MVSCIGLGNAYSNGALCGDEDVAAAHLPQPDEWRAGSDNAGGASSSSRCRDKLAIGCPLEKCAVGEGCRRIWTLRHYARLDVVDAYSCARREIECPQWSMR